MGLMTAMFCGFDLTLFNLTQLVYFIVKSLSHFVFLGYEYTTASIIISFNWKSGKNKTNLNYKMLDICTMWKIAKCLYNKKKLITWIFITFAINSYYILLFQLKYFRTREHVPFNHYGVETVSFCCSPVFSLLSTLYL